MMRRLHQELAIPAESFLRVPSPPAGARLGRIARGTKGSAKRVRR